MGKPGLSPQEYLDQVFCNHESFREHDPDFYQVVKQGLQSSDGVHWIKVADALYYCTMGWAPFFLEQAARNPRALCWLTAAVRWEFWSSGANQAEWLRWTLRTLHDADARLADLEKDHHPWTARMSGWARRILHGQDKWVGQGQ
jgi:hypothetical protein